MKDGNESNEIATYVGIYFLLQGVLCVFALFFIVYQMFCNQRSLNIGGIVFLLITASISLLGGYKIIMRYK